MDIDIYNWSELDVKQKNIALQRPDFQDQDYSQRVADIVTDVRDIGDSALLEYAKAYDGLLEDKLKLPASYFSDIDEALDSDLKEAIDEAFARIKKFHLSAKPENKKVETADGVTCEYRYRGYERVGLYIPGGSAPLLSTVLMTGIPALIADVNEIILCTPAQRYTDVHVGIRYAAKLCGIVDIYCVVMLGLQRRNNKLLLTRVVLRLICQQDRLKC